LVRVEHPQARTLWIMGRAGAHRAPGTWGVSVGTLASGDTFTRRIDMLEWSESREVTETVRTESGGTAQVTRTESSYYSAGSRADSAPDTIGLTTEQGPLVVRGCRNAVWGTSRSRMRRLARKDSDEPFACIEESIAHGDSVAVYGRLQIDSMPGPMPGQRLIEHTGPGSLMIFAAPGNARAALRRRLLGHVLSLVLMVAALVPALYNAFSLR
jgi:hypothetical protein